MTDRESMNKVIDELIESARLVGVNQAKREFGVYTQADAIMERALWDGIGTRVNAIRAEVAALKAERDELLKDAERYRWLRENGDAGCTMKDGYGGQELKTNGYLDAAVDEAIAKAEGGAT